MHSAFSSISSAKPFLAIVIQKLLYGGSVNKIILASMMLMSLAAVQANAQCQPAYNRADDCTNHYMCNGVSKPLKDEDFGIAIAQMAPDLNSILSAQGIQGRGVDFQTKMSGDATTLADLHKHCVDLIAKAKKVCQNPKDKYRLESLTQNMDSACGQFDNQADQFMAAANSDATGAQIQGTEALGPTPVDSSTTISAPASSPPSPGREPAGSDPD
jgi:hypothetical protein